MQAPTLFRSLIALTSLLGSLLVAAPSRADETSPAPTESRANADAVPVPAPRRIVVSALEAAFGAGELRVGKVAPNLYSGVVERAPMTVEELTPSVGLRSSTGSLMLLDPLAIGTVDASHTGAAVGNLTVRFENRWQLGAVVALRWSASISAPTGSAEELPSSAWGPERSDLTQTLITGGAIHAAARAMTGFVDAGMWDSHRWGSGSQVGLELRAGGVTFEPYFGADSRISFAGRSSPGVFLAGVRVESRVSDHVVLGSNVWFVDPDAAMQESELTGVAGFAQIGLTYLASPRLKFTASALAPVAGPSDAPRLLAFRGGVTSNF